MARPRTEPPPAEAPPLESEQNEAAEAARGSAPAPAAEPEVRPEELAAGIEKPVGDSAWPDEIVEELRKPLDPNRVRSRQGRGSGKFEYLAGHDVKRRANQIFGFGNWGHRIVDQKEIGAIEVTNQGGNSGWHVGYRCIVRIWVRHAGGSFETEGSGYGDAVEYTPSARITACELALKESETDALKRAFTDLGDQFGLILYAKGDEKARIAREDNAAQTTGRVHRQNDAGRGGATIRTWAEAFDRFDKAVVDPGQAQEWLAELLQLHYGVSSGTDLSKDDRDQVFAKFRSLVMELEETEGEVWALPDLRDRIARLFASKFDGVGLHGPAWRIAEGEGENLPTHADWKAARQEAAPAAA